MKYLSWTRLLPILVLLLGLGAFFYFRLYIYIDLRTLKSHRDVLVNYVHDHVIVASIVYIATYIILTAISAPGAVVLTLIGGFLFGLVWGTIFVAIGATLGATIIFLAAKTALHDFLYAKAGNWFKKIARGFKNNVVSYMLFLRLIPLFPFWLVNIVPAFFGVTLRVFMLTTFFGILPGTFVYVMLGNSVSFILSRGEEPNLQIIFQPEILMPIVGLAVLALVPVVYKKWRH